MCSFHARIHHSNSYGILRLTYKQQTHTIFPCGFLFLSSSFVIFRPVKIFQYLMIMIIIRRDLYCHISQVIVSLNRLKSANVLENALIELNWNQTIIRICQYVTIDKLSNSFLSISTLNHDQTSHLLSLFRSYIKSI